MKQKTLSFWQYPGPTGRLRRTTYRMSEEDARRKFPGLELHRYPSDSITIDVPETPEEEREVLGRMFPAGHCARS